jgi:hypothetical protein
MTSEGDDGGLEGPRECTACGALIGNMKRHEAWHETLMPEVFDARANEVYSQWEQ